MATDSSQRRRRILITVAALVVVVVVAAVAVILLHDRSTKAASPAVVPTPLPSVSDAPSASPSASGPETVGKGDYSLAVTVQGRSRTFILHVPPAESAGKPLPLALVYHGALESAASTQRSTDFDRIADQRGFLVAFLDGYKGTWNTKSSHTVAEIAGIDDVAFTSAALADIEQRTRVDKSHVAAAGFSNGALFTDLLGCKLAGSISVIVPTEGPLPVSVASTCAPARPVSVLEIHGTADETIRYGGGSFVGAAGGTTVLSAPAAVARWASLDGCAAPPKKSSSGSVRLTEYSGCRGGVSVALVSNVGAGHAWPPDIGERVAGALGLAG